VLSTHNLRHHCAFDLYQTLHNWLEHQIFDYATHFTLLDCILSLKLDPASSFQPGQGLVTKYNCAIAHQLGKSCSIPPEQIALDLYQGQSQLRSLRDENFPVGGQPIILPVGGHPALDYPIVAMKICPPSKGWMTLEISWSDFLSWLGSIEGNGSELISSLLGSSNPNIELNQERPKLNSKQVVNWQYTHARCCSLLRQAHETELIRLTNLLEDISEPPLNQPFGPISSPSPVPWNALMTSSPLRSIASERELLLNLISTLDSLSSPLTHQYFQRTLPNQVQNLCTAFSRFHQTCRIWEPAQENQLALAQARLGLISLTQQVLMGLMQQGLGLDTPSSL
jgi:DALR anticodon binding domain